MSDHPNRQTKAYSAFKEECQKLALFFGGALDQQMLSKLDLGNAVTSFHQLKGSAGFFGHEDVGQLAGRLEEIAKSSNRVKLETELKELVKLLEEL
jgi:HPt (histidine-containing phosphotransfer) domain-containing protein